MDDLSRVDVADGQGVDGGDPAKDVHHLQSLFNKIHRRSKHLLCNIRHISVEVGHMIYVIKVLLLI